jgi:hypothetical protein
MKRVLGISAGFVLLLVAAMFTVRASAAQPSGGRYSMSTHTFGNNVPTVVVVLDSQTGAVTPYVIHTNNSLSAGDLRLTAIRVAGR